MLPLCGNTNVQITKKLFLCKFYVFSRSCSLVSTLIKSERRCDALSCSSCPSVNWSAGLGHAADALCMCWAISTLLWKTKPFLSLKIVLMLIEIMFLPYTLECILQLKLNASYYRWGGFPLGTCDTWKNGVGSFGLVPAHLCPRRCVTWYKTEMWFTFFSYCISASV